MSAVTLPSARPRPRRPMAGGRLLWHQIRYEQLSFWRNTQNAVFTFAFPVLFMTVLGLLMRGGTASSYFYGRTPVAYYMPTIAALSVIGTCYGQLAVVLAMRRQDGILKRVRATPLPAGLYFLGLLAHCLVVAVTDVALIIGIGALFGAPRPAHWLALAVTLAVGAACFCGLGVAVASLVRNAEAAPAVVQLVLFPLLFLSGTYLPIHSAALNSAAGMLPIRPFNQALLAALNGSGLDWMHLAPLAAWGVAGAVIGIRRFRWNPRPE
jgi:ABC-2 type transport system permease protein